MPSVEYVNAVQNVSAPDDQWNRFASGPRSLTVAMDAFLNPELLAQSWADDVDSAKASLFYAFDTGGKRKFQVHIRHSGSMNGYISFTALIARLRINITPNEIMRTSMQLVVDGKPERHAPTVSNRLQEIMGVSLT